MLIIKQGDPINVSHIQIMIYGSPGCRKTSVACSSDKPLLINFDSPQNALKAFGRPDSIHVASTRPGPQQIDWETVRGLSGVSDYNTLVIDTAGRMVDCIGSYVEGRLGIPSSSTFKYYSEVKAQALRFFSVINSLGLDIVFVAHEKSDEIRKRQVLAPMIAGGSGGEIYRDCLAIGHMCAASRGRFELDFEPSDDRIAKNYGLNVMSVPMLEENPRFMAEVISDLKSRLIAKAEESTSVKDAHASWAVLIAKANSAEDLTSLALDSKKLDGRSSIGRTIKGKIMEKALALKLTWNSDKGEFESEANTNT